MKPNLKLNLKNLFKRDTTPVKRGVRGPFISGSCSVTGIMLHVIAALVPIMIWAVYLFGVRVLVVTAVSVASALGTETLLTLAIYKKPKISDLTAVVTGLMLAMTLPAAVPLWIPLAGGVLAIGIKQLFGGTGRNLLNPALFAHTVLTLVFGKLIIYTAPLTKLPVFENVGAELAAESPMAALTAGRFPSETLFESFFGRTGGTIGEVSAVLIIAGAAFLMIRKVISYKIPVAYLLTVAVISYVFPKIDVDATTFALYSLISGGVLFAAVFMATDHTTSPCTTVGQIIYGVGCGVLTMLLRYSGLFYDGAYPAVLIMNEFARPIDSLAFSLTGPVKKKKAVKTAAKTEGAEIK